MSNASYLDFWDSIDDKDKTIYFLINSLLLASKDKISSGQIQSIIQIIESGETIPEYLHKEFHKILNSKVETKTELH